MTGGVHLFLTRVMGLSDEDNRARSTAGPAPYNHSYYRETETLQNGDTQSAMYNKYGTEVMVVHCWSDRWQVQVSLSDDSSVTVHQTVS